MKKIFIAAILIIFCSSAFAQERADTKYWIFFKDKGEFKPDLKIEKGSSAYEKGKELITERAVKRRLKVLDENELISFADLPLDNSYISEINNAGIEMIAKSKWLNGVSAYLTKDQIRKIASFDFVKQIKVVNKLYKQVIENISSDPADNVTSRTDTVNVYDYGKSYKQMEMVNVPKLHNMNITGKGIMIASFDDGFDWKNHEALKNLRVRNEYDFINNDQNTYFEKKQKYKDEKIQGQHGTATLSSMS